MSSVFAYAHCSSRTCAILQVDTPRVHDKAPAHTADPAGDLDTPGREGLLACMDQAMLAEAHAAMMTIENSGDCWPSVPLQCLTALPSRIRTANV